MFADKQEFKIALINKLSTLFGKNVSAASSKEIRSALAGMVLDQIGERWNNADHSASDAERKQAYYLSIEFLPGRLSTMNLYNCGVPLQLACEALLELGVDIDVLYQEDPEPGLGSGGLGRLAACLLDSAASLGFLVHGFGLRYRYGLFEQTVEGFGQVERPDHWLKDGWAWEVRKLDEAVGIRLGGTVRLVDRGDGRFDAEYENSELIWAVPYDVPIIGCRNNTVNTLRLWSVDHLTNNLYPNDQDNEGRLLRLKQQYLLVSASLQTILRKFKEGNGEITDFPEKVAIHINDTHPALAVPELMRLLMDREGLDWDTAWDITVRTISYTNHTILPEALETWPIGLMSGLLPRIYMIISEIQERQRLNAAAAYGDDPVKQERLAIIVDEQVHMARLAFAGSHSINGVAKLHTEILRNYLFADYHQFYPHRINNKTNGVNHRRWLVKDNPDLAGAISDVISDRWIGNAEELKRLCKFAADTGFQQRIATIKRQNKAVLAKYIQDHYQITIDLDSIFDVQVKRFHAYKRQLLNILHVMHLYNQLRNDPEISFTPRTFIFSGKAAANYYLAKQIIKLINVLAFQINNDPQVHDKLKVIFLENYSVSLAELIIPAADVSEQISTASKEASGTGNMKLMMNGALTLGTLDGANVEIRDAVGPDNIFIFGLTADQVLSYYANGGYSSRDVYHSDNRIQTVMEQMVNGFLPQPDNEFRVLYDHLLLYNDEFFVLGDFSAYAQAQELIAKKYQDAALWQAMSIQNIAHAGSFSSDRTVREYAQDIWQL